MSESREERLRALREHAGALYAPESRHAHAVLLRRRADELEHSG